MKNQPSKLLLALAVCFSMAAAHAENNGDNGNNGNKSQHSNKDTSGRSVTVAAADSCSAKVLATPCGPVQVTTCSTNGSTTSTAVSNAQKNKDTERHKDDGKDRGDGKDHTEGSHKDNSKYSGRDASKDDTDDTIGKPYGYHWEQTNSGGVKQRKVTICHRDGGSRTTLDVDDDGAYHGHDQDGMDTEGACEDQDDKSGKHTDAKNSGRAVVAIHKDAVCGVGRVYQPKNDGKHHIERDHHTDEGDNNSKYSKRDKTKDDASGYRWTHDLDGTVAHQQRKVIVCHRMGNARVTIDVDDDGWYHGHDKHPNDTIGRCEDQDDSTHRYTAGNLNGQKPADLHTEAACASTSSSATTTSSAACTAAGGVTTVLGGLGCGGAGVSCAPLSTGTRPIRGGLRNVR